MLRVCFNSYESYTTDQVYQWDQNHTLRIVGLNLDYAPAIHFANKKSTEAVVVHSTKDGEDITAPIPNLLLQEPYNIIAYIHIYDVEDENARTIEVINIPLIKRIKPSEYQFEDNSDIMNFERLETDIADFIATMTEDFDTYKAELQEEIETKETNIKNYADERDLFWVENVLDNTQVSIENGDKDTLEEAKSYSDANLETAKKYSDENQEGAKTYANTTVLAATIASARAYADGQDGINLASAKTYSDTGDSTTLASAKTYADSKDSTTLQSAKAYVQAEIYTEDYTANYAVYPNDTLPNCVFELHKSLSDKQHCSCNLRYSDSNTAFVVGERYSSTRGVYLVMPRHGDILHYMRYDGNNIRYINLLAGATATVVTPTMLA